jgi:phosphoglycolate phosphatase-like HAD superfamily hydrolase
MRKLFVWDLHGTLETGNDRASIDTSNAALEQFGYSERFTYADGAKLYGLKWYEYFEWLLGNESHERHLELQDASFELSEKRPDLLYHWMQPTEHSHEVLTQIGRRHQQILISNTRNATLAIFLKLLGIEGFFAGGRAIAVDAHARAAKRDKTDVLREYLAASDEQFEELVVIGDSPSDMRLGEVFGGLRYLFTHPGFEFRPCAADYRIRDLRKVLVEV